MRIDQETGLRLAYPVYDYRVDSLEAMNPDLAYSIGSLEVIKLPRGRALADALRNDSAAPPGVTIKQGRYYTKAELQAYVADYCGSFQAFHSAESELIAAMRRKDAECQAAIDEARAEVAAALADNDRRLRSFVLAFEDSFSIDITEHSQTRCGVYFLRKAGSIVYVGQSVNVYSRVAQHERDKDFDTVTFVPCQPEQLDDLEGFYIRLLCPPLNGYSSDKNKGKDNGAPKSKLWDASRTIAWPAPTC